MSKNNYDQQTSRSSANLIYPKVSVFTNRALPLVGRRFAPYLLGRFSNTWCPVNTPSNNDKTYDNVRFSRGGGDP